MSYLQRAALISGILLVFAFFAVKLYHNFIIIHFETGPYFYDSGWFAYLFGKIDPSMANPRVENELSYYAHHLSPLIHLWTYPVVGLLGLDGVRSFALFNFLAAWVMLLPFVVVTWGRPARYAPFYVALVIATVFVASNELLFRAVRYPHFELMVVGLTGLVYACLCRGVIWGMITASVLLVLLREDGGFYAAYAVLVHAFTRPDVQLGPDLGRSIRIAAILCAVAITAFLIQHIFFPGFDTFGDNFSGNGFDHLTFALVWDRVVLMVTTFGQGSLLIWSVAVLPFALLGWRALRAPIIWVPIVLMSPLVFMHLIALRDVLGTFLVYYGLPFAIITMMILLGFLDRMTQVQTHAVELLGIASLLVATAVPVNAWFEDKEGLIAVEKWNLALRDWPEGTVPLYKELLSTALATEEPGLCVSEAVASFDLQHFDMTNALHPKRFAKHIDGCDTFLMMDEEIFVNELRPLLREAGFVQTDKVEKMETHRRADAVAD